MSDLFSDEFKSSLFECHSNADEKKALELLEEKYKGKNVPVQKIYQKTHGESPSLQPWG